MLRPCALPESDKLRTNRCLAQEVNAHCRTGWVVPSQDLPSALQAARAHWPRRRRGGCACAQRRRGRLSRSSSARGVCWKLRPARASGRGSCAPRPLGWMLSASLNSLRSLAPSWEVIFSQQLCACRLHAGSCMGRPCELKGAACCVLAAEDRIMPVATSAGWRLFGMRWAALPCTVQLLALADGYQPPCSDIGCLPR